MIDSFDGFDYFTDEPRLDWVVHNFLPRKWVGLLNAQQGGGKTTLAVAMAKAVSLGTDFLGQDTQQGKVGYLNLDGMPRFSFKQMCEEFSPNNDTDWINNIRWVDQGVNLPYQQSDVIKTFKGCNLIIIDTLAQLAAHSDLSERDEKEMTILIRSTKAIAKETNSAVLILHHMTKYPPNPKDPGSKRQFRGNTAIPATVDVVYDLEGSVEGKLSLNYGKSRLTNIQMFPITIDETGYHIPKSTSELGNPRGAKKGLIRMEKMLNDYIEIAYTLCIINRDAARQVDDNTWEFTHNTMMKLCNGKPSLANTVINEMIKDGIAERRGKSSMVATFSDNLIAEMEGQYPKGEEE